MEKVIECPYCNDKDRCFEDVQDTFSSFMCFNCGYMSHSNYTEEKISEIQHTSQLIRDLAYKDDDRDIYWYPSVVNMGKLGIIYPDGKLTDWYWHYAKVVEIPEEDREKYDGHERRLDVENSEKFGQFEFMEACKSMGIIKDNG